MYRNISAELARNGMTQTDLAKALKVARSTMSCKISGKLPFTLKEALEIKDILKVDAPLEELFKEYQ